MRDDLIFIKDIHETEAVYSVFFIYIITTVRNVVWFEFLIPAKTGIQVAIVNY